jgi:hypothetical protein
VYRALRRRLVEELAREAWLEALEICQALRIPEAEEVRARLAKLPPARPSGTSSRSTAW